jgi:hypothetical protein
MYQKMKTPAMMCDDLMYDDERQLMHDQTSTNDHVVDEEY